MAITELTSGSASLIEVSRREWCVATGLLFTEGPLWDPGSGRLLFSDIRASRIYAWHPQTGLEVYREPSGKANGLTWDIAGRLVACEHLNRRLSVQDQPGEPARTLVARYRGRLLNSPNDVACRSDGTLYFTDPPYGIQSEAMGSEQERDQPCNGLYMLRPGTSEPVLLADDFERPNGLAFSPDERLLYVADTPRYHLRSFRVSVDGTLTGGRVLVELDGQRGEGRPDGMKVDQAGRIYTTGPGGLWVLDPAGAPLLHVALPEKATNCAWGNTDWRSLYITAGGSVYRLRCAVPGNPPPGARSR